MGDEMYKINYQDDFLCYEAPTAAVNIYDQQVLFLPFFAHQGGYHYQGRKHFTEREHDCGMYYLLFTIDGNGSLKYENETYNLKKGSIFYVDANTYHYYKTGNLGYWKYCYINLYGRGCKMFYDLMFHKGFRIINSLNIEDTLKLFDNIYALIEKHSYEDNIKISEMLSSFLHDITGKAYKSDAGEFTQWNMQYAIKYMESNFAKDITITEIANEFNVSNEYFIRQFKAHTGISPYRYLINLRLNLAKNLLISLNRPIFEIATLAGFNGVANMLYCFNKYEKISPNDYRKINSLAFDIKDSPKGQS